MFDAADPVDELLFAELFFAGCVFLDQAVGVAQHPIATLEHLPADPGLFTAEADGQDGRASQLPDDLVVTDQQRCGVARVNPLQVARRDVQPDLARNPGSSGLRWEIRELGVGGPLCG
ncbi:hypothetical protein ADL25_37440 [Streptomyces sp. NRRL F-5122]|nr:hypothetical protein ADL25_37440 [Streptomyces sp. NRRL F-5122]